MRDAYRPHRTKEELFSLPSEQWTEQDFKDAIYYGKEMQKVRPVDFVVRNAKKKAEDIVNGLSVTPEEKVGGIMDAADHELSEFMRVREDGGDWIPYIYILSYLYESIYNVYGNVYGYTPRSENEDSIDPDENARGDKALDDLVVYHRKSFHLLRNAMKTNDRVKMDTGVTNIYILSMYSSHVAFVTRTEDNEK